jgi:hypothetical protein
MLKIILRTKSYLSNKIVNVISNFSKPSKIQLPYNHNYLINGTINLDSNPAFGSEKTYPNFQQDLEFFKNSLSDNVISSRSKSYYKFGDGDYYFLKGIPTGSAKPGNRAISRKLTETELKDFLVNSNKSDYYMCEIYPENRDKFARVFPNKRIDFPAEFVYGLVANKWLFEKFGNFIGLIGADVKLDLIEQLMGRDIYKEYLGIEKFQDYVRIPQKFACDDLNLRCEELQLQLKNAKSKLFLVGIGHLKSGVLGLLPGFHNAIYLDVGSGIDGIAGIIDNKRPFFGDWTNFKLKQGFNYNQLDLLQYENSKEIYLN